MAESKPYTVTDWVTEMGLRAIAEATAAGSHGDVAALITAMAEAKLIDGRRIQNPRRSKAFTRAERQRPEEPDEPYPIVGGSYDRFTERYPREIPQDQFDELPAGHRVRR